MKWMKWMAGYWILKTVWRIQASTNNIVLFVLCPSQECNVFYGKCTA